MEEVSTWDVLLSYLNSVTVGKFIALSEPQFSPALPSALASWGQSEEYAYG